MNPIKLANTKEDNRSSSRQIMQADLLTKPSVNYKNKTENDNKKYIPNNFREVEGSQTVRLSMPAGAVGLSSSRKPHKILNRSPDSNIRFGLKN